MSEAKAYEFLAALEESKKVNGSLWAEFVELIKPPTEIKTTCPVCGSERIEKMAEKEEQKKPEEDAPEVRDTIIPGEEVYKRDECVFTYCPNPNFCQQQNKCKYPTEESKPKP